MLSATPHHTLAEVVLYNFRAAEIFEMFELNFSCYGRRTLLEACEAKKINLKELLHQLNETILFKADESETFGTWDLDFIVFYITEKHHSYTKNALRRITDYTYRIADLYSHENPQLWKLNEKFKTTSALLQSHITDEEKTLFPYITKLSRNKLKTDVSVDIQGFADRLEAEHLQIEELLEDIKEITDNYNIPYYACKTYSTTMDELKSFEKDIHKHFHIEINILFPKAVKIENSRKKWDVGFEI